MKTPMQELIDYTTDLLHTFDSEERVALAVLDYLKTNKKSMLEKEKEVMESAWQDGMYECDGDGTFEDFYKTFNTKEK